MQTLFKQNPIAQALSFTVIVAYLLVTGYMVAEPTVTQGATSTDTFTIRQQITGELSLSAANDVTMVSSIAGITGGSAFGTTSAAVSTNNPTGYSMTIQFSTTTAMQDELGTSSIPNYNPAAGGALADYTFTLGANEAGFAYTVDADASDVDLTFRDNGSACGAGSNSSLGRCWYQAADATNPETIINRSSATTGAATTTLVFQVGVSANPIPAIPTGFYTATATLTAFEN